MSRLETRHVDVIDEAFLRVSPLRLAPIIKHPLNHRTWWPHLQLQLSRERGAKGAEWVITGQVVGTLEIWLEPFKDGTILHHYVRGSIGDQAPPDTAERHVRRWKIAVTALKDILEGR